jgi:Zn-dependent protease
VHSQIKLGRIAGIEIGLHYSWFLIAILIAFSLAGHFHSIRSSWSDAAVWAVAIFTAILFFVALLLHELAHSLVAKSKGLRVREITLFALGGVSQIDSEAPDAKSEFLIAIAGPLTSLLIGGLCILSARLSGWHSGSEPFSPALSVLLWLGYINIALAAFNMIPGYPLDGGRVLRAILWWISGNMLRATRWASQVGQGVALLFILLGLYRFFVGENFGGLWIAFIGWFLLDAARSSYIQLGLVAGLRGRRVADIMERDCPSVEGYLSVRDFVDEYLLHSANRCFVVLRAGSAAGTISPNELRNIPRDSWQQTSVQSIMRPLDQLHAIPPDMPAIQALELLSRERADSLPVVSQGKLQGIFSRGQILRFLQLNSGIATHDHKIAA